MRNLFHAAGCTRARGASASPAAATAAAALLLAACGGTAADAASGDPATAEAATAEAAPADASPAAAGGAAADSGWRPLFDGASLAGWHRHGKPGVTDGWAVEDGAIVRTGSGGDLITEAAFTDFEFAFEWRVSEGGNSGVFYRLDPEARRTFESAPEYQILDDARHRDGGSRLTSAGSAYGLYPAPDGLLRPVGAWNTGRIVVRGDSVEHWVNGTRAVGYRLASADWEQRVAGSKFAEWPDYGRAPSGRLGLQDHGDRVAFRALRVREFK